MTLSPSGSDPSEAAEFLAAHPEIEAVDLILHDANAIARGKIIRRHELEAVYRAGRPLPVSILGLDICGEDVGETGLVWEQGDRDLRAWPVPGSLRPVFGSQPPRAEVFLSLYEHDGEPMAADPRHAMAAQVAAFQAQGLTPAGAFELEFFLIETGPDGRPRPARALSGARRLQSTEVYSVDALLGFEPLFSDIYRAAEQAGLRAETMISEYAPGQFELTLAYRRNALQAADDLLRLKRILRAQAQRHEVQACFMPKPFADQAGSGMHFHVSLQDRAGANLFAAEGVSEPLRHAIGGVLSHMAESMLVFAPHANSWRRFARESYAPVALTWGVNNRSVAVRVPAGAAAARRLEHRPSGVDANPYLVGATVLAAMRQGLLRKADPGPEVTGNGYETAAAGAALPADWRSALVAAQGSEFLKEALGAMLHRSFTAIIEAEYLRHSRSIPDVDYDLYLHRM